MPANAVRHYARSQAMSVRNLGSLFSPSHVAVVGAGGERTQLGHIVVRNIIDAGFEGTVYPINPKRESVGGIQAYPDLAATPHAPELAVVCTPAATVPDVVRQCGERGVGAICVISAGFRETGAAGRKLEDRVGEELARYDGLRLMGPNCLGLIVPRIGLNASFAGTLPSDGQIAFITQSGALATSIIDWACTRKIGFSHVISVGNMLDVDLGDAIDYVGQDPGTRAIILYIESVTEPRKFMSAARGFAQSKPIVAFKAGRFPISAAAAVSHTGAMAGEDAIYDTALRRAGIVRVVRIEDIFATAELLARAPSVGQRRLAIVTNAGGPGVMAVDALLARGGTLAKLEQATLDALDSALPAAWSHGNPIDVLGDAPPERFGTASATVLADPGVDAVLVILTPQAMTDPSATADAVLAASQAQAARTPKPLLGAWMGGRSVQDGLDRLSAGGAAAYTYPEQAVDAFMDLVGYAGNLETLRETPRLLPASYAFDRPRAVAALSGATDDGLLSETAAKDLLDACGIPVVLPRPADGEEAAVAIAEEIGYPVVLKLRSPQITHKTDVGGVELNLGDAAAVRSAYQRILAAVHSRRPDAVVEGVTVQPMAEPGLELVLGARKDPTFGAVILIGAGGVAAELLHDQALELPPLNERLVRGMLQSLRIWPLLAGYRGRPGVNVEALIELVSRFSYLVAEFPQINEIEINPLLADAAGAVALDARATVDAALVRDPPVPFSHLAIRPYPEEYTRDATTSGALQVTMRAIRPEDEPLWQAMLDDCSPQSREMRFGGSATQTHETAARYCFIDYDRELAIVAEVAGADGAPQLAGVVRLAADPDHRNAEYAVLVADPWQGRGLSDLLTDYCLEIARAWGITSVYAEAAANNERMIAVLTRHGFPLAARPADGVLTGARKP